MRAAEVRGRLAEMLAAHQPKHLVHVGAHEGEEVAYYLRAGVERITLIEPLPHLADRLRRRWPGLQVLQVACSDHEGAATLRVPRRTNMASLELDEGEPVVVATRRLDVVAADADAAVIDVQGHEFAVLAAAPWQSLRLLVVETCTADDPAMSPPYDRMVSYMADRGFREVERFVRDYDWIQRWAYGRSTDTGAEVRDVVFVRD